MTLAFGPAASLHSFTSLFVFRKERTGYPPAYMHKNTTKIDNMMTTVQVIRSEFTVQSLFVFWAWITFSSHYLPSREKT